MFTPLSSLPQDILLLAFHFCKVWIVISLTWRFPNFGQSKNFSLSQKKIALRCSKLRMHFKYTENFSYVIMTENPFFVFWILHSRFLTDWFINWRWNVIFTILPSFSIPKLPILPDVLQLDFRKSISLTCFESANFFL